jgi:DNA ligase-1
MPPNPRSLIFLGVLHALIGTPAALADGPTAAAPVPATARGPAETPVGPPALMLASLCPDAIEPADYWVSEKLDGVRAYWDGHRLVSRKGNPIRLPEGFTAGWPREPMDGELWLGRGTFATLVGLLHRAERTDDRWREVQYRVFDAPAVPGPFGVRRLALERLVGPSGGPHLRLVAQTRVADRRALLALLDRVTAQGGEGLVLHRDSARYRAGRSQDLLKLKRYMDAEARVVGHLPGQGRFAGMLGALLVETDQGVRFRLGSGLSEAQRRHPPPLGSLVTFRYRGLTPHGVPRFASFLRVRDEP